MDLFSVIEELEGIQQHILSETWDEWEVSDSIGKAIRDIKKVIEEEKITLSERVNEIMEVERGEGHIPKNNIQVRLWYADKFRKNFS